MKKYSTESADGKGGAKMDDGNMLSDQVIDRRGGFTIIENYIFELGLSPQELAVYAVIVRHANIETAQAFPSYPRIMKMSGVKRTKAIECVASLVERGLLIKSKREGKEPNALVSNLYIITRGGGSPHGLPPVRHTDGGGSPHEPEQDSSNKRKDIAGDKSPAKRARPRNPYFDAIVTAFGYEAAAITKTQASGIGKVAAELKDAGYAPEDVAGIYAHVKAQNYSSFTPAALSKHAADWKAKAAKAKLLTAVAPQIDPIEEKSEEEIRAEMRAVLDAAKRKGADNDDRR